MYQLIKLYFRLFFKNNKGLLIILILLFTSFSTLYINLHHTKINRDTTTQIYDQYIDKYSGIPNNSKEKQILKELDSYENNEDILKEFNEGFAKKVARGLDIAAFHGLNPRTGEKSAVVGENNFDSKVTQTVTYANDKPDDCLDTAIATVEDADCEVTGIVINSAVRSDLSKMKSTTGDPLYPEFRFGGKPSTLGSQALDTNNTVSFGSETKDQAIVGDFANMFKWGYSKDIPLKVIEYGDPDNSGKDLQGYNQVYIRAEVFMGWGILDANSFTRVVKA